MHGLDNNTWLSRGSDNNTWLSHGSDNNARLSHGSDNNTWLSHGSNNRRQTTVITIKMNHNEIGNVRITNDLTIILLYSLAV